MLMKNLTITLWMLCAFFNAAASFPHYSPVLVTAKNKNVFNLSVTNQPCFSINSFQGDEEGFIREGSGLHPATGELKNGATIFSGGTGTKDDPYRITTAAELEQLRNFPQAHFRQMADINLGVAPWNTGQGWKPLGRGSEKAFSGSYDGNGFKILNLTINMPDSSYVGFFGRVAAAVIKGVTLVNTSVKGKDFVGALAGQAIGGNYSALRVSGNVTGAGEYAGGAKVLLKK